MPSLNKVMLMGNLTRDPEIRYTPKGQAVTDIGLAINRRYKVENEVREEVTFVDITFWGKSAEIIGQYLKKGRPLYVEGRLQLDTWDDKQTGQKKSRLKVIGDEFQFIDSKPAGAGEGGRPDEGGSHDESRGNRPAPRGQSSQGPPARQESGAFPPGLDDEDEIPF
jgi:single-strand DNA-binding protein